MKYTYFALLRHPSELKALLMNEGEGWTLPHFAEDTELDAPDINRRMSEQLGQEVTILRMLRTPQKCEGDEEWHTFSFENHGMEEPPEGGRWFSRGELNGLNIAHPFQFETLQKAIQEWESGVVPAHRSPWAREGWLDEARAWINERLEEQGISCVTSIEQFRTWSITCILKFETEAGEFFFKASHPMFPHEAALTLHLHERYPGQNPQVVAADTERNWFLMKAFKGTELGKLTDVDAWEESLRRYSRIQVESAEQWQDYVALGCPDRRLEFLCDSLNELIEEESNLPPEYFLTQDEQTDLQQRLPQIKGAIEELSQYGLPPALIHGDLHPWNIVVTEDGPLFFDWSDGAVSHPFFELLMEKRMGKVAEAEGVRERLLHAYLESWTAYAPMDRLLTAFRLSQKLLPAYHALSYHHIVVHCEPGANWELGGGVVGFLRDLLKAFGGKVQE